MLRDELDSLVGHLRDLGRPVVLWLRPGIDAAQVASAVGADVPASVVEWFAWHNGVEMRPGQLQDDVNVIPAYNPLSLDEAIHIMPIHASDPVLGGRWLPLLTSSGGDIYAATWDAGGEAQVAGVLVGEATELEFSSIEQMASVFNACFEQRAFFVNDAGRLVMDPQAYEEIYDRTVAG
jgi:hypothetical protein